MTIIAEETMYESSVVQYFTEKGIERGGRERAIEDLLDVLEIRLGWLRRIHWPLAYRASGIYSVSSSGFGRPYRSPAWKPLGSC